MKIVVFGANGKVGRVVVEKLLERGHSVSAFVHGEHDFVKNAQLKIVKGDIYDPKDAGKAIAGNEIVISTLGSWGTPKKDILSVGMSHIIDSAKANVIKRVISLTGADARMYGDKKDVVHRVMYGFISLAADKILRDGESHIEQLRTSGLDWVVIRSPVMNETGDQNYQLSDTRPKPWQTIHRHAVAESIVSQIDDYSWSQKSPFITRS